MSKDSNDKEKSDVRKEVARPLGAVVLVLFLALLAVWGIDWYAGGPALGPISDFLVVLTALHLFLFWMVRAGSQLGYWLYRIECLLFGVLIPGSIGGYCRRTASRLKSGEVKSAFGRGAR